MQGGDPYPTKTPMEAALFVRDENGCPNVPADTPPELEAIMRDCWKCASLISFALVERVSSLFVAVLTGVQVCSG